jgi:hypothetical protein
MGISATSAQAKPGDWVSIGAGARVGGLAVGDGLAAAQAERRGRSKIVKINKRFMVLCVFQQILK